MFQLYFEINPAKHTNLNPFLYKILCKKRRVGIPGIPATSTMYKILYIKLIEKKEESLYIQGFYEKICYR